MYPAWIKLEDNWPWIELEDAFQNKAEGQKVVQKILSKVKIRIAELPKKTITTARARQQAKELVYCFRETMVS